MRKNMTGTGLNLTGFANLVGFATKTAILTQKKASFAGMKPLLTKRFLMICLLIYKPIGLSVIILGNPGKQCLRRYWSIQNRIFREQGFAVNLHPSPASKLSSRQLLSPSPTGPDRLQKVDQREPDNY